MEETGFKVSHLCTWLKRLESNYALEMLAIFLNENTSLKNKTLSPYKVYTDTMSFPNLSNTESVLFTMQFDYIPFSPRSQFKSIYLATFNG